MNWTTKLLVISNKTIASQALFDHMSARAANAPTEFTIVVPRTLGTDPSLTQTALARFRASGLDVEIRLGDRDPLLAVRDYWEPSRFDEVVAEAAAAPLPEPSRIGATTRVGLSSRTVHA